MFPDSYEFAWRGFNKSIIDQNPPTKNAIRALKHGQYLIKTCIEQLYIRFSSLFYSETCDVKSILTSKFFISQINMSVELQDLLNALNLSITPFNTSLPESSVQLTAMSFGSMMIKNEADTFNWPEEYLEQAGRIFCTSLFTNSIVFGMPTSQYDEMLTQIIYSSSTLCYYYDNLILFINSIKNFINHFTKSVTASISGEINDGEFTDIAMTLVKYLMKIQILAASVDMEAPFVPSEFDLPKLSPIIEQFTGLIVKCIKDSDQIKVLHNQEQPITDAEAILNESAESVLKSVDQNVELITNLKNKINNHFKSSYNEPVFQDFQQYLQRISILSSKIAMIAIRLALFDKDEFINTLQKFQSFTNNIFYIESPITTIMRFRGDFDKSIEQAKQNQIQLVRLLKSLPEILNVSLSKAPTPFIDFINSLLPQLLKDLVTEVKIYPSKLDNVINFMKSDRRFSVFQGINLSTSSIIVEKAKATVEATGILVKQILKDKSQINEIVQTIQTISNEFTSFNAFFVDYISQEMNLETKMKMILQKDTIFFTMTEFAQNFQIFQQMPGNNLLRVKVGILASKLLLSFTSLSNHSIMLHQISSLRSILTDSIIEFFPQNMKILLELFSLFINRIKDFPEHAGQIYIAVLSVFMTSVRDSVGIFTNSSPNDPLQVINCINECDKIQSLLYAMCYGLEKAELPNDIQNGICLLGFYAFIIKNLADDLRYCLQLSYVHATDSFVSTLESFVEVVSNTSALQAADDLKDKIKTLISPIREKLNNTPPFGKYDFAYLDEIVKSFIPIMSPTQELLRVTQNFLAISPNSTELGQAMNIITLHLNNINGLIPYVTNLKCKRTLALPTLIGFHFKNGTQSIEESIEKLNKELKNDTQTVSANGHILVTNIYNLADSLEYLDQTRPVSNQIRQIGSVVNQIIGFTLIGQNVEQQLNQQLDTLVQFIAQIKPFESQFIEQVRILGAQGFNEIVQKVTDALTASQDLVQQEQKEPDKPKYEANVPSLSEVTKMENDAKNSPFTALLNEQLESMKKDIEEHEKLVKELEKDPNNQQIIDKLAEISNRIKMSQDKFNSILNFKQSEPIQSTISNYSSLAKEDKVKKAPELLLSLLSHVNEDLKDPIKSQMNKLLKEISTDPEVAALQLETIALAQTEDTENLCINYAEQLKQAIEQNDEQRINELIHQLATCDRVRRIMQGDVSESDLEAKLLSLARGKNYKGLLDMVNNYESCFVNQEEETDESEIPDQLMDLSNEISSLGVSILADLKNATPETYPEIQKKIEQLKSQSLDFSSVVLKLSNKRDNLPADTIDDLHEEINNLVNNLESIEHTSQESVSSPNKASQIRQVGKFNRDMISNLNHISEICDQIIEIPKSSNTSKSLDIRSKSNSLMNKIMSLMKIQNTKNDKKIKLRCDTLRNEIKQDFNEYKQSIDVLIKGIDGNNEIPSLLDKLGSILNQDGDLKECFKSICEIQKALNESMSTEVSIDNKLAASLPFRFTVPLVQDRKIVPINECKTKIDQAYDQVIQATKTFSTIMNDIKAPSEGINTSLLDLHKSLADLILPIENMQFSTWNPQCQSELNQIKATLISFGDAAIDSARNRLLGQDGWRESLNQFLSTFTEAVNKSKEIAESTVQATENDLLLTNEAQRELVNAARAVQASQQKLTSLRDNAKQMRVSAGEAYLGCELIEISSPILNSAAKLIDVAQQQMKFILERNPNVPNQKGLTKTAADLVNSLELIIVAAESTINSESDGFSKVLASCNIVSSAVAHFLAECYQKDGNQELNSVMTGITDSIQGLIKQLRSFSESAMSASSHSPQPTETGKKPINAMIEKLNAEAKVVEARRALEEAERKLKETRKTQ